MVVSPVTSPVGEDLFAPYERIDELGSRPSPVYIVRHVAAGGKPRLLVAERFAGAVKASDGQAAAFAGEARRISTLASPTVARVRELAVRGDDLVAFWDFIDGEKLVETWPSSIPLEVTLRLILDVLSGVGAIHGLRDAKQQPMQLAHGEVSTATIILGLDGVARVLHPIARRLPGARAEEASLGYLAPEVHAGRAYDARADVFGAGVLLWEALSGKRLFSEGDAALIIERVGSGIAPAAVPDKAPWARGLVQVAAKALAASPDDRWPTAAAMAAEIRKVAGLKLAPAMAAAAFAQTAIGERVRARRERLESAVAAQPRASSLDKEAERRRSTATARSSPGARLWSDDDSTAAVAPRRGQPLDGMSASGAPRVDERPPAAAPLVAPVAAVVEVGPDTDVELVPETLPPAAPSPPPLPARALQPSRPAQLDAAIDVPISIAPPPADPFEMSPTSIEQPHEAEPYDRAGRRRMAAVLGGVAALGLIVFALAGWRVSHRSTGAEPSSGAHVGPAPVAIARPAARPPAPAPRAGPAPVQTPATTAAALASSRAPRSPAPAVPVPTPKPSSAVPPSPKLLAPSTSRPRTSPSPNFDPNSL